MPHPKQMVAAIDAYLAALAARDVDAILALYAEDATVEDPVGGEPVRGKEALRAFYERAVQPQLAPELTGSVKVAGAEAAFAFTLRMPDAGMRIDIVEAMAFDDDGKVRSMRAWWGPKNMGPL